MISINVYFAGKFLGPLGFIILCMGSERRAEGEHESKTQERIFHGSNKKFNKWAR